MNAPRTFIKNNVFHMPNMKHLYTTQPEKAKDAVIYQPDVKDNACYIQLENCFVCSLNHLTAKDMVEAYPKFYHVNIFKLLLYWFKTQIRKRYE